MLVSVIIPMYNREQTIKMAVESILGQTYQNFELIIVDDCSTDRSVEIAESIEDERIRVIKCEKNGGACAARNIGIDNAKGEVVAFQDSDDFWHKDKLEKSLYYLERENADFVFSALCREETKKGKIIKEVIPKFNLNSVEDKLSKILCQNYISTQTIVAKRKVFEIIRFDPSFPRFQDWDLSIQVIRSGFKVYYINESLVDSYLLGDSISYSGEKAVKAIKLLEKKYINNYKQRPEVYRKFCERAGYLIEMSGYNGWKYFYKAYKLDKKFYVWIKYALARVRLYWILNKFVSKFVS